MLDARRASMDSISDRSDTQASAEVAAYPSAAAPPDPSRAEAQRLAVPVLVPPQSGTQSMSSGPGGVSNADLLQQIEKLMLVTTEHFNRLSGRLDEQGQLLDYLADPPDQPDGCGRARSMRGPVSPSNRTGGETDSFHKTRSLRPLWRKVGSTRRLSTAHLFPSGNTFGRREKERNPSIVSADDNDMYPRERTTRMSLTQTRPLPGPTTSPEPAPAPELARAIGDGNSSRNPLVGRSVGLPLQSPGDAASRAASLQSGPGTFHSSFAVPALTRFRTHQSTTFGDTPAAVPRTPSGHSWAVGKHLSQSAERIDTGADAATGKAAGDPAPVMLPPPPGLEPDAELDHAVVWLPDSPWRVAWDMAYLFLQLLETCLVLLTLAFNRWTDDPSAASPITLAACSVFFCVDLYVKSRTAVLSGWELVDHSEEEVRAIYLRTWGPYDAAVMLPYDLALLLAGLPGAYRVAGMLRLLRVPRIHGLFLSPNPLLRRQRLATAALFAYYFILVHHLVAVCWMATRATTPDNADSINNPENTAAEAYVFGLYWAATTLTSVGYGDITPDTTGARIYAIFVETLGVGMYAYVLGNVSAIVHHEDFRMRKLKEKRDKMVSLMHYYNVPWSVQKEAFGIFPVILEESKVDYVELLGDLPPFLQEKIGWCIKLELASRVPLFAAAEPYIMSALVGCLESDSVGPAEYIIRAGDIGSEMYILAHGLVEVVRPDECGEEEHVGNLKDGSWFGEPALLQATRRACSVRTITTCDIFVLRSKDFAHVLALHPGSRLEESIQNEMQRPCAAAQSAGTPEDTLLSTQDADRGEGAATEARLLELFRQCDPAGTGTIGRSDAGRQLAAIGCHGTADDWGWGPMVSFAEFSRAARGETAEAEHGPGSSRIATPVQNIKLNASAAQQPQGAGTPTGGTPPGLPAPRSRLLSISSSNGPGAASQAHLLAVPSAELRPHAMSGPRSGRRTRGSAISFTSGTQLVDAGSPPTGAELLLPPPAPR
eukprot:TRINITY_DN71223_c0_g1_i1.p1 TRINITY_DN71223_c0_g1~~TRINITY_DN71223_c0_g1_i1.p1  ORF type:complete len:997 (+),score=196.57 TRINITY_DN71223_c0_g1_i1:111-3101(+)